MIKMDFATAPKVALVVPIHNGKEETEQLLQSLTKNSYPNLVIVFVDDGSTDGSSDMIRSMCPEAIILQGTGDLYWSRSMNMGVEEARRQNADFVLVMNNDIDTINKELGKAIKRMSTNKDFRSFTTVKDTQLRKAYQDIVNAKSIIEYHSTTGDI